MSKRPKSLALTILLCGCTSAILGQGGGANLLKTWNINGTEGNTVIQEDGVIACESKDEAEISGVVQTVELNQASARAIEVSAESKAENVSGDPDQTSADYSIYLDLAHPDGTNTHGVAMPFKNGTHDWEKASLSYTPTKPIKAVSYYLLFRNKTGRAWFRNAVLIQKAPPKKKASPRK